MPSYTKLGVFLLNERGEKVERKVLVLGARGMLGQELVKQLKQSGKYTVYGVGRTDTDICIDLREDEKIKAVFEQNRPDIVINAAANIMIDSCEENRGEAYLINSRLPYIASRMSEEFNAYYIQISTDHYYCNDGVKKHKEEDGVVLLNEYAKTKYLGECMSLVNKNSLVVRTNIVGFRKKIGQRTFIEWVVDTLKNKEKIDVYDDFFTSSMHTVDFSKVLIGLFDYMPTGVVNLASSDVTSKKDFILGVSQKFFGRIPEYRTISIKEHAGVKRADSLGLDVRKIEDILGIKMPTLEETIDSLYREYLNRS